MLYDLATTLHKGLLTKLSGSATDVLLGTGVFGGAPGVSGLTTGGVLFGKSDGTIAQDATNFIWDDTNNRLGLGTASPNEQLEITANLRLAAGSVVTSDSERLLHTTGGNSNVFLGQGAGNLSVTGSLLTIIGANAGVALTSPNHNVFIGYSAGSAVTSGGSNTIIGSGAGANLLTGVSNVLLGQGANVNSSSAAARIAIGAGVVNGTNNTVIIGDSNCSNWRTTTDGGCTLGSSSIGWKGIFFDHTNTTVGTTGNQTINKPSGRVNIAAAGTTVTVTNSLVTAASQVFAQCVTNDATAFVKNVVPAAGSFVVNLGAAATAEVAIAFFVVNTD